MACSNGVCSIGDNMAKKKKTAIGTQAAPQSPPPPPPPQHRGPWQGFKDFLSGNHPGFNNFLGNPLVEKIIGSQEKFQQFPNFNPEQTNIIQQLGQMGLSNAGLLSQNPQQYLAPLQQLLQSQLNPTAQNPNKFNFAPIAAQARANFNQQTIPSIAERFTGMGGQNSGAFAQALSSSGANLDRDLAALQQQYNLQNRDYLGNLAGNYARFGLSGQQIQQGGINNLLGYGLTPLTQNALRPATTGLFQQAGDAAQKLALAYLTGKIS